MVAGMRWISCASKCAMIWPAGTISCVFAGGGVDEADHSGCWLFADSFPEQDPSPMAVLLRQNCC
eukprot:14679277-Ditylum_brightwellii.AAC.1